MKVQVPLEDAMADVLEAAAEHIRAGWTQGRPFEYVDGQRYVCANGALWLAAGLPVRTPEGHLVTEETPYEAPLPETHLTLWSRTQSKLTLHVGEDSASWNDSIGQTQANVADTMLQLAKELRPHEPA